VTNSRPESSSLHHHQGRGMAKDDATRDAFPGKDLLPRVSIDFRCVLWTDGELYHFTAGQAAVVKVLWEAWLNCTPELGLATLHERGYFGGSLPSLFRVSVRRGGRRRFLPHPALGPMIIRGATQGTWRLAGSPPAKIPNIGTDH
jgi:hypothetical protein